MQPLFLLSPAAALYRRTWQCRDPAALTNNTLVPVNCTGYAVTKPSDNLSRKLLPVIGSEVVDTAAAMQSIAPAKLGTEGEISMGLRICMLLNTPKHLKTLLLLLASIELERAESPHASKAGPQHPLPRGYLLCFAPCTTSILFRHRFLCMHGMSLVLVAVEECWGLSFFRFSFISCI